jgi:hypothetical protein
MRQVAHYPQILESVRNVGQILPLYIYQGSELDGRLRQQAALECGLEVKMQIIHDEQAAATLLWSLHPDRAIAEFDRGQSLTDLSILFSASPRIVHAARRARAIEPAPKYERRDYKKKMSVRLLPDCKRTLIDWARDMRSPQQDVICAALRIADAELVRAELGRMRAVIRRRK